MIVVETNPNQQSFQPWDVVADANGNFQTSWYVFSSDFIGAKFQATATGDSSQLSAVVTPQAAPITGTINQGGALFPGFGQHRYPNRMVNGLIPANSCQPIRSLRECKRRSSSDDDRALEFWFRTGYALESWRIYV
jgi:hypothetical protein